MAEIEKKINTLTTEELIEIIREYAPNTITGGNIYIQNTEPSDPDCVWIDTNGIDLITE
jgi:cbb3-type cytochrome oxidase cytochrome c subunit